jgi:hypothetical protein
MSQSHIGALFLQDFQFYYCTVCSVLCVHTIHTYVYSDRCVCNIYIYIYSIERKTYLFIQSLTFSSDSFHSVLYKDPV